MTEKTVQKLSIGLVPPKEEPLILRSHKIMIAYSERQYGTAQKLRRVWLVQNRMVWLTENTHHSTLDSIMRNSTFSALSEPCP